MITTKNLSITPVCWDDFELYHLGSQDPKVMRFIGDGTVPSYESNTKKWENYIQYAKDNPGFGAFTIRLLTDGSYIGNCNLNQLDKSDLKHVGYRLLENYWGNGYASEAARALVKYGFEEKYMTLICAVVDPENTASHRVLEKAGLTYIGMENKFFNTDLRYYTITRAGYENV